MVKSRITNLESALAECLLADYEERTILKELLKPLTVEQVIDYINDYYVTVSIQSLLSEKEFGKIKSPIESFYRAFKPIR